MAKILLVAQKLTPTVVKLTTALRHQQHAVTVMTSRDEDANLPEGIELLRPFRRWSFTEGLRVLPILYGMNPQIVHLVLEDDRLNAAQTILSLAAKALPHAVLTTSLLHIRQGLRRRNPVRYLLQESDIVTCPSVESLGALRGLRVRTRRQGRGILPPVLDFDEAEDLMERSSAGADLVRRLQAMPFVVIPLTEPDFDPHRPAFRRFQVMASHRHVVLLGSLSGWSLRERKRFQEWTRRRGLEGQWTVTGELSRPDLRRLLSKAEALVLAGKNLSPRETTEYFLHALQAGTTLVLDQKQAALHSELWRDGGNCWILSPDDLANRLLWLMSKDDLRLPQSLPEDVQLQRDLIDAPLNELNRLYNKALSQKHYP